MGVVIFRMAIRSSFFASWEESVSIFFRILTISEVSISLTSSSASSPNENRSFWIFFPRTCSATCPGSPVEIQSSLTFFFGYPDCFSRASRTSLSDMPNTPGTKSGWTLPWQRYTTSLISDVSTVRRNSARMAVISRRLLVDSSLSKVSARSE